MWFVPTSGFAATKARPQLTKNMSSNSSSGTNVFCIDAYGHSRTCDMICKVLPYTVTTTEMIASNDFSAFSCTLVVDTPNSSMGYVITIPQDNYLLHFTNWTTTDYNFTCRGTQTPPTAAMLCRNEFSQCLSSTITDRYIPPSEYVSLS